MGLTITESFETRKAYSEVFVDGIVYFIDYVATGPIDGQPTDVNGYFFRTQEEDKVRVGYGYYGKGVSSIRFESGANVPLSAQVAVTSLFMNDLAEIIK